MKEKIAKLIGMSRTDFDPIFWTADFKRVHDWFWNKFPFAVVETRVIGGMFHVDVRSPCLVPVSTQGESYEKAFCHAVVEFCDTEMTKEKLFKLYPNASIKVVETDKGFTVYLCADKGVWATGSTYDEALKKALASL